MTVFTTFAPAPASPLPPVSEKTRETLAKPGGAAWLTVKRPLVAVKQRAQQAAYSRTATGRQTISELEKLKNAQPGATGVVVCNGPSLNRTDLELLRGVPFILMNRGYLLGDRLPGTPTALCVSAMPVIEQYAEEIGQRDCPLFLTTEARPYFADHTRSMFLMSDYRWQFATDLGLSLNIGATVTYSALQLAFHLGWTKTIIIGMDHNYDKTGDPRKLVTTSGADANHFHPDYFQHGAQWLLPDLARNEYSYVLARDAYEKSGRDVVDCTVGGMCEIFRKSTIETELSAAASA